MNLSKTKKVLIFLTHQKFNYVFLALLVLISFAHLYRLSSVPTGLYVDETSIGYNAATISQSGVDEYGNHFPVYFKAFGEYKNPVYIYAAAIDFKLFGISNFTLRFTSFVFYLLGLIFSFFLISNIFNKNRIVQFYFLLAFGFLPQLFTLSRISFEVISQMTFISATLLLIWKAFAEQDTKKSRWFFIASGIALGISIYTYTTARVLSCLLLAILWVVYLKRENIKKLAILTAAFFVSLIPLFVYAIRKPGSLTTRVDTVLYLFSDMPVTEKISTFFNHFISYWSLDYLIFKGDSNLRHSIGFGGIVFVTTFFLLLLGIVVILANKKLFFNRFNLFLLANLAIAPVAGALTTNTTPHALRGMLLGYFILIFSCFGINFLTQINHTILRRTLIVGIIVCLVAEVVAYAGYYFIIYPSKSVAAMDGYGIKELMQQAIDQNPKEVDFYNISPDFNVTEKFYLDVVSNPQNIPFQMIYYIHHIDPGICYLFRKEDKVGLVSSLPYTEYIGIYQVSAVENLFNVNQPPPIYMARCYKPAQ